jgi:hypothetical protein
MFVKVMSKTLTPTLVKASSMARALTVSSVLSFSILPAPKIRKYTELTVVHELVHLALLPLVTGENDRKVEDTVEDMAEALVLGNVPACATPRDFMEAEIVSLPWKPGDARIREQVIRKLTAAFLDGRPSWTAQHTAACAATIKTFFARSGWR